MFVGYYEHTLDEKGRMIIPSRFRDGMINGAYITRGFDQNLFVLPAATFANVNEQLGQLSLTDLKSRDLRRFLFTKAVMAEFDRAGRILIPAYLREHAGIQNAAVVVGAGEYFEIWSPERWEQVDQRLVDPETASQAFSALEISIR